MTLEVQVLPSRIEGRVRDTVRLEPGTTIRACSQQLVNWCIYLGPQDADEFEGHSEVRATDPSPVGFLILLGSFSCWVPGLLPATSCND